MNFPTGKEMVVNMAEELGCPDYELEAVWELVQGEPLALDEKGLRTVVRDAMLRVKYIQPTLFEDV